MALPGTIYFQIRPGDGQVLEVEKEIRDSFLVGRRSRTGTKLCDLHLDDDYASRRHCRLLRKGQSEQPEWMVEDLGSSNGTRLNGEPVSEPELLAQDGWVQIGTTRITFSYTPKHAQLQDDEQQEYEGLEAAGGDTPAATLLLSKSSQMQPPLHRSQQSGTMVDFAAKRAGPASETVAQPPEGATVAMGKTFGGGGATVAMTQPSESDAETVVTEHSGGDTTVVRTPPRVHLATTMALGPKEAVQRTMVQDSPEMSRSGFEPQSGPVSGMLFPSIPQGRGGKDIVRLAMGSKVLLCLLQHHFLEPAQAAVLLARARDNGEPFFRTLAQDRSVKFMAEIFRSVGKEFGWPLFDLEDLETFTDQVTPTDWLPFTQAAERGIVVLRQENPDVLYYGTVDPFDMIAHDWIERCAKKPAQQVLVHPDLFFPTIRRMKDQPDQEAAGASLSIDFTEDDENRVKELQGGVDVPQMVNYFLHRAHLQNASDIHIEPTEELFLIRNRVDGILHEEITLPKALHPEAVSRLKILSGMDVAEKRRPQDGRLAVTIRNNPIDVRVSSYPTVYGEKFVLRLLDKNALRPSIDSLGLMDSDLRLLKEKLGAPYGLIMISGPTGSGKTTSLYSCLGSLDKTSKNVLTVEDPVEYRMPGVHQMQVNSKIGLTFASGLRTILRQDPDVIMVGEIRDNETAAMAVQASLTGHIVFSTIHTNDAVGVVTRLLDMDIEPFLVATSLSMAIAQRLVRAICPHCRIAVSGSQILADLQKDGIALGRLENLGIEIEEEMDYTQGAGCERCRSTGYLGRTAVFELFEMTDEARTLVMSPGLNAGDLKKLAREKGMTTLIAHGVQLVEEERTTFQEVIRVLGEDS